MTPRRFPPPWSVEDIDACFVVRDNGGQKLAYVYYEGEAGRHVKVAGNAAEAAAAEITGFKTYADLLEALDIRRKQS